MPEKPSSFPQALEGRETSSDGRSIGDTRFHEQAWATTPTMSAKDLEMLKTAEAELGENQAESLSSVDAHLGVLAYQSLLSLHPHHPRNEHWKSRIAELGHE